jgi:hypothetical protein
MAPSVLPDAQAAACNETDASDVVAAKRCPPATCDAAEEQSLTPAAREALAIERTAAVEQRIAEITAREATTATARSR